MKSKGLISRERVAITVEYDEDDARAAAKALIDWFKSQNLGPKKALVVMSLVTAAAVSLAEEDNDGNGQGHD